ncbi:hypothetical protein AB1Y20_022099 [Prymnesium parvum]|uniref:Uncharacterized protein n=1 Tax=Prymnesium parvum TaxID=97485 RepID=A0AB34JIC8_PRYPA
MLDIADDSALILADPKAEKSAKQKIKDAIVLLNWENSKLAIIFSLFVVMRAMDRVFSKRVADRMANYQLMYFNVLWPVGVQFFQILMCIAWVCYHRYRLGDTRYSWKFFLPGAAIATAAGTSYPQWRLGLFSFWDQLNAVITGIPTPYISQNDQGIMSNFVIIWTVVISIFYLNTRYNQEHYLGCALIIMSGLVSVVVNLQTNDPPLGEYATASGGLQKSSALWYAVYVLGTVPSGISNCYKQKCLKSVDLEVMYASLWSGYWQILWGVIMFPINWIPMPAPAEPHYAQDTAHFIGRAWTCFWGSVPVDAQGNPYSPATNVSHTVYSACNTSIVTWTYTANDEVCASAGGSAALWFVVYILFNVTFNVLLLWLTKRMSGTWAQIGTVLCLDLASLFSQFQFIMGSEAQVLTVQQWFGLIIAGIAMWVYNLKDELDASGNQIKGVNSAAVRSTVGTSFSNHPLHAPPPSNIPASTF